VRREIRKHNAEKRRFFVYIITRLAFLSDVVVSPAWFSKGMLTLDRPLIAHCFVTYKKVTNRRAYPKNIKNMLEVMRQKHIYIFGMR